MRPQDHHSSGARHCMPEDRNHVSHPPPDVALLLRAHSEQRLLSSEVIPVLRQLEAPEHLPEEQLSAAAAYLEVIWAQAAARARETDAALCRLEELDHGSHRDPEPHPLPAHARRYHAVVRGLREAVARRVAPLIAAGYAVRASSPCSP